MDQDQLLEMYKKWFRALLDASKEYTDSTIKNINIEDLDIDLSNLVSFSVFQNAINQIENDYYTKDDIDTGYLAAIDEFRIENNLM